MASSKGLDRTDRDQADEMTGIKSSVIFEAIRVEGEHELKRSFSALWWSGVTAGLAISTSVLCVGFLTAVLPHEPWTRAITSLGYPVGFLLVIFGRMQLFTENTITPVLTLLREPSRANLVRTLRLWAIVFSANLVGCLLAATVIVIGQVVPGPQMEGILEVARHYGAATPMQHLQWGMPAGFLIASLVWVLPTVDGAGQVLMISIITYVISLGGLSHVIAGSTEVFVLVVQGELTPVQAVFEAIAPTLLGNVIGGTGMFAALTYAQVRLEV